MEISGKLIATPKAYMKSFEEQLPSQGLIGTP